MSGSWKSSDAESASGIFFDNQGFVIVTGHMAGIAIIPSEQRKQWF